jgi:hypothetical protein
MIILSYHQTNNFIQVITISTKSMSGSNLMTCTLHPMLRTSAEITCEAALFLNDKEQIKAKCNFRFLLNKIKPHILKLPLSKF